MHTFRTIADALESKYGERGAKELIKRMKKCARLTR